ncbi:tripartite tricarboxylate transporter substrate binding protein [Variovorax sp. J22P168]|uniref:Bug family tripartite tricarboxylate transporter substrate binding protein n=1 Tax=Variovorax jilinensis TaxID=3053513 RepID=UPI0025771A74|nr:tripartite tricarboxylate transporter substrate binding protein [Variovorax sp. J22P168]MDM0011686.1 tripartite tricarboxylate transporter substrate binding protein [Variovorax sp. J22P168]
MKNLIRLLASGLLLAAAATTALAQGAFPNQPIKWLVPYSAGGGTDSIARQLAEVMQQSLGQPIVIDNKPGASTNIAVATLMQAKPDGYTIMQAENAALLFNEHMFGKLPYKPASDFTYIGAIGRIPLALVVRPDFTGGKSLGEFVSYVKANPDKLNYASPGVGTPHQMAMELFKQKAGLGLTHVAYKGGAPAMQDMMGGQVQVMMLDLTAALPYLKAGKLRALAIALPQRAKALPDVPTFAELGYPQVNAFAFHGLIGPAGMPPEIVDRLNAELRKAMQAPRIQQVFGEWGFEALPGTPKEFRDLARSESAHWGEVIKSSGVRLD